MTSADDDSRDGLLASLLVAYDEALAGEAPPPDVESIVDDRDLVARLREAKACVELLDRVRRLDSQHATPHARDDTLRSAPPPSVPLPAVIGRFTIERELGRGGLGIVYLAYDPELRRHVAIKIPRADLVTGGELERRFVREAEAAARLSHPNLVALHEVGRDGLFWYLVSEYCAGPTLAELLRSQPGPMPPREAANLIRQLADAVHHAHSRGVLHRDIKPSNVILSRPEAGDRRPPRENTDPVTPASTLAVEALSATELLALCPQPTTIVECTPKLTDFGMAKLLESAGDETRSGAILGTPAYMAPEQADGRIRELDARTDVYGLGAVLYELLTGAPPYRGASDVDTLRQLLLDEPVAPRRLFSAVPRDLEAICLKCLARESAARFPSAQHLVDDLGRFLAGQPTDARPLGPVARLAKWARRRPALAALAAVIALALFTLFGVVFAYNARLSGEVARAEREAVASRRLLYSGDVRLAYEALQVNNVVQALDLLRRHVPRPGKEDLREFTWHYLREQCEPDTLMLKGHTKPVMTVAFSPDGRQVATGSEDGTTRIWDAATGKQLFVLHDDTTEVDCVAFSPDGRLLVAAEENGSVRLWDPTTGEKESKLTGHGDHVLAVAFSPDGKSLASGSRDTTVRVWDIATGATIKILDGRMDVIRAVAFSPDGSLLYAVDEAEHLHVWRTADWEEQRGGRVPREKLFALAISHTGSLVAAAGRREVITLWNSTGGKLEPSTDLAHGHTQWIQSLAFSPADDTLASGGKDGLVQLWRPGERRPYRTLKGHTGRIWSVSWSSDGRRLASAGADNVARIWTIASDATIVYPPVGKRVLHAAYSSDGKVLFTCSDDGKLQLWDTRTRAQLASHHLHDAALDELCLSPDGSLIATRSGDGVTKVFSRAKFEKLAEWRRSVTAGSGLSFSPSGRSLAILVDSTNVAIVEVGSWRIKQRLPHGTRVRGLAFTRDGRQLVTVGEECRVWDIETGMSVRSLAISAGDVAVSDDDRLIALGMAPNVALLDRSAHTVFNLTTIGSDSCYVAFHGNTLAVGTEPSPIVCLWDTRTGQELARLACDGREFHWVTFSPDGTRLVAVGNDAGGNGRIWEWTVRKRP